MAFDDYVDAAVHSAGSGISSAILNGHHPLLNGAPYKTFRSEISIEARRSQGTFFSGPAIGRHLADRLRRLLPLDALVVDPTCGIGDLLLAYAQGLPVQGTLHATLVEWGKCLGGIELRPDLLRMAKARLVILARTRGNFLDETVDVDASFPLLLSGDMFGSENLIERADGLLFNPPFGKITTPDSCRQWFTGRVNAAAVFLDHLLQRKKPTAIIGAVLPEVLRCGSNYSRFRDHVMRLGTQGDYTSFGQFDGWTDVDVFCTLMQSEARGGLWLIADAQVGGGTLDVYFDVRVGTVVPHRHEKVGPIRAYICAKTTPRWSEDFCPNSTRAFSGTTFAPPFVVLRRTSSPSDRTRAVASLIKGSEPVAVENHLIVLLPKDGTLSRCLEVMETLKAKVTSDFLNANMRCRHLTTAVVKAIPFVTDDD